MIFMKYEFLASGGILETAELSRYESMIGEGDRGLVELDLRLPVPQSVANDLQSKLRQAGVEELSVRTSGSMLQIYFRKGFPWLAVIAAAILGIIVLAVLIVGWRIFREVVPAALQPLVGGIGVLLLLGLGAVILARRF